MAGGSRDSRLEPVTIHAAVARKDESAPGPGGWAAVLRYGDRTRELHGMEPDRTSGDLRILAVVSGLEALTRRVRVCVHSPGARPASGEPAEADPELLSRLAAQRERHDVVWATDAEPPNRRDHDRARELAARDDEAARERIESPRRDSLEEALDKFLAEQREHLSEDTFEDYETVIDLLRGSLNNYGAQDLQGDERRRFEDAYERHDDGGAFCRVFGPEKIPENIGEFLGYSMARKVITTQAVLQATGPTVSSLGHWLTTRDYGITAADVEHMLEYADDAADDLPAAEKLRRRWNDLCDAGFVFESDELEVQETVEDVLYVSAVEPGLIRFADHSEGRAVHIDVAVPEEISDLAKRGWEMYVEGALIEGEWQVSMIGTVYT